MSESREAFVNVGIDFGKDQLDISVYERGLHLTAANDPAGSRCNLSRLARDQLARMVVDASGRRGYNLVLAADIRRHICHLPGQVEKLDARITSVVDTIAEWREKRDLLWLTCLNSDHYPTSR